MFQQPNQRKISPIYWFVLSSVIIAADYITGPYILFQILYIIPILMASWFNGRRWGLVLSCSLPLVRIVFRFLWAVPWGLKESIFNAAIYIIVFSLLVFLVYHEKQRQSLFERSPIIERSSPNLQFL